MPIEKLTPSITDLIAALEAYSPEAIQQEIDALHPEPHKASFKYDSLRLDVLRLRMDMYYALGVLVDLYKRAEARKVQLDWLTTRMNILEMALVSLVGADSTQPLVNSIIKMLKEQKD